jgi:hypothetical protein
MFAGGSLFSHPLGSSAFKVDLEADSLTGSTSSEIADVARRTTSADQQQQQLELQCTAVQDTAVRHIDQAEHRLAAAELYSASSVAACASRGSDKGLSGVLQNPTGQVQLCRHVSYTHARQAATYMQKFEN